MWEIWENPDVIEWFEQEERERRLARLEREIAELERDLGLSR
jgi:hypothetical protein